MIQLRSTIEIKPGVNLRGFIDMRIERTAIYNVYGIIAKDKNLLFNALHEHKRGFGVGDQVRKDLSSLMKKIEPTDNAPLMSREGEMSAIEAAFDGSLDTQKTEQTS
mgnify:CR=1 FL=1